ncbi:hypothetical protein F5X99DRAFT_364588 [Biscogniauxia marginata]|nr:hypothetical protein F5X99DRAFT_364588 [Biscogniauxia marginata]
MHNSACPKCGAAFGGNTKTCGSCGAVSSLTLPFVLCYLLPLPPCLSALTIFKPCVCGRSSFLPHPHARALRSWGKQ